MKNVRLTHGECGDLSLDLNEITLVTNQDTKQHYCRYSCPQCSLIELKELKTHEAYILAEADGIKRQFVNLSDELFESRGEGRPSISTDELIDFHNALEAYPDTVTGHNAFQDAMDEIVIARRLINEAFELE